MNFSHLEQGAQDVQHVLKNQVFQKMLQLGSKLMAGFWKILCQVPYVYMGVCVWKHTYKSLDSNYTQIINTPAGTEETAKDAKWCTYLLPKT